MHTFHELNSKRPTHKLTKHKTIYSNLLSTYNNKQLNAYVSQQLSQDGIDFVLDTDASDGIYVTTENYSRISTRSVA